MPNIDIKQLEFIDPQLRKIVVWLEKITGMTFTITSLYRIGDGGVHGRLPVRGIDLRCRNRVVGEGIETLVNACWIYDPQRTVHNCALLHGKGANLHLHLQTHPNTIRR